MWNPDPIVTIAGTDYTDQVLDGVNLNFGAADFLAGYQPPFGRVSIVNITGSALPFGLNDDVQVTVSDSAGTGRIDLFNGLVSDISVSLAATDAAIYDLTLIGYGTLLESRTINEIPIMWDTDDTFRQYDYDRFEYLVKAGTGDAVDLLSGTIDSLSGNIEDLQNHLGTVYSSPSIFDKVINIPEGADTAGSILAAFNKGVSGWVWENNLGEINFRVFDNLSSTSHTTPQGSVFVDQLTKVISLSELYNGINLIDEFGYIAKYKDSTSQATYNVRELNINSQYIDQSVRWIAQSSYLLDYLANNINQLSGLTCDLTVDDFLAADRDALLAVDMTDTIDFTVPDDIFDTGTGSGRVCGWSWEIANKTLNLTLNLVKVE